MSYIIIPVQSGQGRDLSAEAERINDQMPEHHVILVPGMLGDSVHVQTLFNAIPAKPETRTTNRQKKESR